MPPTGSSIEEFSRQVHAARERVATLQRNAGAPATAARPDILDATSAELLVTVEELRVAEEELRQQHEELAGARERLEEERRRYHDLFEFAPDAYLVTDMRGVIREANRAASVLLGVPQRFLEGKPLAAFVDDGERRVFRQFLGCLCGTDQTAESPVALRPRRGGRIDGSVRVGIVTHGRGGEAVELRWLIRDVTERRRAEEEVKRLNAELERRVGERTAQLEAAVHAMDELLKSERRARTDAEAMSRARSGLFAVLSHEFRTPLHAIAGYVELLAMEIHGPLSGAQKDDVTRIRKSQEHLLALVDNILDFSRLESGRLELELADVPLDETLAQLHTLVAPQMEAKGLRYDYRCDDTAAAARADRERLQQIVLNLLSNAVKFTEPGGAIAVECGGDGERVQVRVRDTGHGIPADKLQTIFEPFVQLHSGAGRHGVGTGLGLAISRDLARAMGGDLTAASAPGVGSTFTLTLNAGGGA